MNLTKDKKSTLRTQSTRSFLTGIQNDSLAFSCWLLAFSNITANIYRNSGTNDQQHKASHTCEA
jgi:hypothetical protein